MSLVCAFVAIVIPTQYIGLLGPAPIAIGARKLRTGWRDRPAWKPDHTRTDGRRALTVAEVTTANGGDNLGVYIPMFATSTKPALTVTITVFMVLTGLWCAVAHFLVGDPSLGTPPRRWGRRVLRSFSLGLASTSCGRAMVSASSLDI